MSLLQPLSSPPLLSPLPSAYVLVGWLRQSSLNREFDARLHNKLQVECRKDQNCKEHDGPCLFAPLLSYKRNQKKKFDRRLPGGGRPLRPLNPHLKDRIVHSGFDFDRKAVCLYNYIRFIYFAHWVDNFQTVLHRSQELKLFNLKIDLFWKLSLIRSDYIKSFPSGSAPLFLIVRKKCMASIPE